MLPGNYLMVIFFIWIDTKKNREPHAHKEQSCRDLSNLSCTNVHGIRG